jgi:hypothetical protein
VIIAAWSGLTGASSARAPEECSIDEADRAADQSSMELAQKLAAQSIMRLASLRHLVSESGLR